MKWIFVTLVATQLALTLARPGDGLVEKNSEQVKKNDDTVSFPYYGGLKGHSLNVSKDGKVNTVVILNPKYAEGRGTVDSHFNKIQESAARLVAIQELAKQKGTFSEEDNKFYADSLYELGVAAQSLAKLQQTGEIKDFSKLLQGGNGQLISSQGSSEGQPIPSTDSPSQDDLLPINQNDPYEDVDLDGVSINAPKRDASVAEAKPVGLSIAGEGGVASSKPSGVAIAGREGLAVSSPKATAIAGVSPEEAAAYNVNVPTRNDIIIKAKKNQNQEITAASLEQHKTTVVKQNFPGLSVGSHRRTTPAVYDYDIIEGMTQSRASNSPNSKNDKQQKSKSNTHPSKGFKVYQLPSKFVGRYISYPSLDEPYIYMF